MTTRGVALALFWLLAAAPLMPASGLPLYDAPPMLAPGPLPNGSLPNGSLPNGTLPNGSLPNGTLPNGTLPNGSLPNGTLPNGSLPGLPGRVTPFVDYSAEATLASVTSPRAAWGDYDGDGWDDIMFSGGRLFHNQRDGTFADVSTGSGTRGDFTGGVWGDYNNDGRLDFYATAWRETWDALLRNNGDGTFTNVTASAGGVFDDLPSEAAAWADYDLDGCLDLFVVNYEWPPLEGEDSASSPGTPDILWHNKCDGTFENASTAAGIVEDERGRGAVWGDYNDDGYPDLYVSNYRLTPNALWMNNQNGTFTNVAESAGVDCEGIGPCGHSIGADFGDFDNDGNLDLYVANLNHPQVAAVGGDSSALYRNRGAAAYDFNNIRMAAGIAYCETASNPTWGDYDADGDLDLYVTSIYENRTNNLYRNDGALHFTDVTRQAQVDSANGWGAGWSDYDRDGDLDLLVASSSGAHLYRNPGHNQTWIQLEMRGRASNAAAIGALVVVSTDQRRLLTQYVQGGDGTASQSSLRLFYGLGDFTGETVTADILWPSGIQTNLALQTNRIHLITEPEGTYDMALAALSATPLNPVAGGQVTVQATVENLGTLPLSDARLVLYRGSAVPANQMDSIGLGSFTGQKNVTSLVSAPSSTGPFTITGRIEGQLPSDADPNNDQRDVTLIVRASNTPPTAALSANATSVRVGEPVAFDASGSTDDSGIVQYIFAFGDGQSANQSSPHINHSFASAGGYTVRVTVIDENGDPSTNDAKVDLAVLPPGAQPPEAVIVSIHPDSPSMVGTTVSFDGNGVPHGASIVGYEWMSDQEGLLSTQPVFDTRDLRVGLHRITFRVSDSNGAWSPPDTAEYLIVNRGDVAITFLGLVNGSALTGPTTVVGTAVAPPGVQVAQVRWRVDSGNLLAADGLDEWTFVLDPSNYAAGEHNLTVIVTDSQGLVSSRTIYVLFGKPVASAPNYALIWGLLGVGFIGLLTGVALLRRPQSARSVGGSAQRPAGAYMPPPQPLKGPPLPPPRPPARRVKAVSSSSRPRAPRPPNSQT